MAVGRNRGFQQTQVSFRIKISCWRVHSSWNDKENMKLILHLRLIRVSFTGAMTTDFMPWLSFYASANQSKLYRCHNNRFHATALFLCPWKHQRTRGFLRFSGRNRKKTGMSDACLTYLFLMHPFSTPWKHQKTKRFLIFSRVRERVYWEQMG